MRLWHVLIPVLLCATSTASADAPRSDAGRGFALEDALPPSPSVAERIAVIRQRVQDAVVYPERARRRGITGVTRIRFAIDEDGRANGVQTVRTSGSPLLDRAAEQGARDAGQLPYVFGQVEVPVRFVLRP